MSARTDRRPSVNSSLSSGSLTSTPSSASGSSASDWKCCRAQCLKLAASQAFLAAVSGLHLLGYKSHVFLDESDERFVSIWILVTGIILAISTLGELFVRVWSQREGRPLYNPRTWRRFFVPTMHKLEGFALICLLIGLGKSTRLTLKWAEEGSSLGKLSNQLVIVSVPAYRVIRWMTDAQEISVQRTFRKRSDLRNANKKLWAKDADEERRKYQRKIKVRLQELANFRSFQVLMVLLILFHAFCYSISKTSISLNEFFAFSLPTGYVLTGIVVAEFIIRFIAQGGELYFMPLLNRAEFGCAIIGLSFLFYSTWYEDANDNPEERFVPSGYVSAVFLLLHRWIRSIGIRYAINGDFSHANTVAGVKAVQLFMSKFGDILDIPEQNVHISATDAWIHKAKLRPEAFEGLHVPFTVRDGLCEELHIRMPDPLTPLFVLRIKNLLILLGPGDGLAEAGSLTERNEIQGAGIRVAPALRRFQAAGSKEDYWNYEHVINAKAKLVELLCKRIQPQRSKHPDENSGLDPPNMKVVQTGTDRSTLLGSVVHLKHQMRYHASAVYGAIKRRLASIAKNTCQRVEVSISNATLQYEDSDGCMGGPRNATVGARIGSASLRFKQNAFLQCNVSRAGIYVEPNLSKKNTEDLGSLYCPTGHSWKEPVGNLLKQHPEAALKELRRFNTQERFRLWAFEGTDNPLPASTQDAGGATGNQALSDKMRHRRMERWPEHRLVFMLLHIKLQAGTETGREKLDEEEDMQKSDLYGESSADRKRRWANLKAAAGSSASLKTPPSESSPCRKIRPSFGIFSESPKRASEDEGEPKQWRWNIDTGRCIAPVSLMVDYDQAQCLHRMVSSWQAWAALDNAFRWRPNVSLTEYGGAEADARERRSLARLWWIYAIHRVLAQQSLRPRIPWLDAWWQVTNCSRYRALLAESSAVPAKESRKGSNLPKPDLRWMQELQVRLPILVIATCHKNRQQPQASRAFDAKEYKASWMASKKQIKKEFTSKAEQLVHQVSKFGDLRKLISPKAPRSQVSQPEELVRAISGHTLFLFDDDDEIPPTRQTTSESLAPMQIHSSAGLWDVLVPAFDVRILCPGQAPRPVLLHAKWRGVAVKAMKLDPEDEHVLFNGNASSGSITVTVDDFHVVSPEAGSLLLGGSPHICAVLQPLCLPPVPSGSAFVATQKEGKHLAFAFRGTAKPGQFGLADLHLPHMRIIIYEPLLLALLKFTKKADRSSSLDLESMINKPSAAGNQSFTRHVSVGKALQTDGGGWCSMRNGRMGPFLGVVLQAVNADTDQSLHELLHWSGEHADHIQQVRQLRRLVRKAQTFRHKFEMASGFAGAIKEWRVQYHSGAIHLFQVGEYSNRDLLIEEYQIRTFSYDGSGAAGPGSSSSNQDVRVTPSGRPRAHLPSERIVMFEFNGYSDDLLLPWNDPRWHEDEGPNSAECLDLQESSMWLLRAGGHKKKVRKEVKKRTKGITSAAAGQSKLCRTLPSSGNGTDTKADHRDSCGNVNNLLLPKDAESKGAGSMWESWCSGLPCLLPGALSSPWPSCCNGLPEVSAEDSLTIDDSNINVIVDKGVAGHERGMHSSEYRGEVNSRPMAPCKVPSCTGILRKVTRHEFASDWLNGESARWRTQVVSNSQGRLGATSGFAGSGQSFPNQMLFKR